MMGISVKHVLGIWAMVAILWLVVLIMGGWKLGINTEWVKIYNWDGEYYRSYTMLYSHGHTWDAEGKWINLWKWPSFHHLDTRNLLRGLKE